MCFLLTFCFPYHPCRAYLPTWMAYCYGKCRSIYHTWIVWVWWTKQHAIHNRHPPLLLPHPSYYVGHLACRPQAKLSLWSDQKLTVRIFWDAEQIEFVNQPEAEKTTILKSRSLYSHRNVHELFVSKSTKSIVKEGKKRDMSCKLRNFSKKKQ